MGKEFMIVLGAVLILTLAYALSDVSEPQPNPGPQCGESKLFGDFYDCPKIIQEVP